MSLAQQLAALDQTAPQDFDPEDANFANDGAFEDGEEDGNIPVASGREHYVTVGPSSLRNKLQDIEDPKYAGQRVSRRELQDETGSSLDEVDEASVGEGRGESSENESGQEPEEAVTDPPSHSASESERAEGEEPLAKSRVDDLKRAKAVKGQQLLWNALVDARIRMQKAVVQANRLPAQRLSPMDATTTPQSLRRFLTVSLQLSQDLYDLQQSLMFSNDGLQPPESKRRRLDLNAEGVAWPELVTEATEDRNALETTLHPTLLQTLDKWSTRINAISPSALLSSRTSFRPRSNRIKGATELIDEALLDEKVLGRTRVLRNTIDRIAPLPADHLDATEKQDEGDSEGESAEDRWEVFDDTDFYHQILRDVVDARKDANEAAHLPIRQHKVKKTVDTKASKGRKLRYTTHDKIQNFMVPIPRATWHEEQTDELFSSLLGQGTITNGSIAVPTGPALLADGFKLFG